jgi:hypothetical protein
LGGEPQHPAGHHHGDPLGGKIADQRYSFWEDALSEIDGGATQHLVLLLEEPVALLELANLGLLSQREAVSQAFFGLGALQPPLDARWRDPEVP